MRTVTIVKLSAGILVAALGRPALAQQPARAAVDSNRLPLRSSPYNPGSASSADFEAPPSSPFNPGSESTPPRLSWLRQAETQPRLSMPQPADFRYSRQADNTEPRAAAPRQADNTEPRAAALRQADFQYTRQPESMIRTASNEVVVPSAEPQRPAAPAPPSPYAPQARPMSTASSTPAPAAAPELLPSAPSAAAPPAGTTPPATPAAPVTAAPCATESGSRAEARPDLFRRGVELMRNRYMDRSTPTPGQSLHEHGRMMVAKGEASLMVLHDFDFKPGNSGELNQRGKDQLVKIVPLLANTFHPVIVERTPQYPGLDQARQKAVWEELKKTSPFPVPQDRVWVAKSPTYGLAGREADAMYQNLMSQTQAGGASGSSGTSGGASTFGGSTGGASGGASGGGMTGGGTSR